MKKSKQKIQKPKDFSLIYLLPILLCALIVPWIVFLKEMALDPSIQSFWHQKSNFDFFSYYKAFYVRTFALLSLFFYLAYNFKLDSKNKFNFHEKKYNISIILFGVIILISALFSKLQSIAFNGFPDRYEGTWTYLSYLLMFIITTQLFRSEKSQKLLLGALFISSVIVCIIGAFQFFGMDLFKSYEGKLLILPESRHSAASRLKFNFKEYQIYATLFNTNYVGSFIALFLPFSLICYLKTHSKKIKVLFGMLIVLFFINFLGCRSRAGFVGVGFSLILSSIIFLTYFIINRKTILAQSGFSTHFKQNIVAFPLIIISCLIMFFIMDFSSNHSLTKQVSSINNEMEQFVDKNSKSKLKDIKITKDRLSIITQKNTLSITFANKQFRFLDSNDKPINLLVNADTIRFDHKNYKDFKLVYNPKEGTYRIKTPQVNLKFYYKDGFKIFGSQGFIDELKPVEKLFFEGKETLASKRGYIWSRTIPLILKSPLNGHGQDTFTAIFPQHDYVGKIKAYKRSTVLVDKPHNAYLQIAFNNGIFALLCFLAFVSMLCFSLLKSLFVDHSVISFAFFSSILAYLITLMFNDSLVSVTPVFYLMAALAVLSIHQTKLLNK